MAKDWSDQTWRRGMTNVTRQPRMRGRTPNDEPGMWVRVAGPIEHAPYADHEVVYIERLTDGVYRSGPPDGILQGCLGQTRNNNDRYAITVHVPQRSHELPIWCGKHRIQEHQRWPSQLGLPQAFLVISSRLHDEARFPQDDCDQRCDLRRIVYHKYRAQARITLQRVSVPSSTNRIDNSRRAPAPRHSCPTRLHRHCGMKQALCHVEIFMAVSATRELP